MYNVWSLLWIINVFNNKGNPVSNNSVENNIIYGGIYSIELAGCNLIYIGSAKKFINRFNKHLHDLQNNKHHNTRMNDYYYKYDLSTFDVKFTLLKVYKKPVPLFFLHAMERKYINRVGRKKDLFNVGIPSKLNGMSYLVMKLITLFD